MAVYPMALIQSPTLLARATGYTVSLKTAMVMRLFQAGQQSALTSVF